MTVHILFIFTGNICGSPMAKALLTYRFGREPQITHYGLHISSVFVNFVHSIQDSLDLHPVLNSSSDEYL